MGLVAGCVDTTNTPPSHEEVATTTQALNQNQCPIWQCGSNSPEINGVIFHDLSEAGLANLEGFHIETFRKNGVSYQIDVRRGRLYGLDSGGNVVLSAANGNLAGAHMLVRNGASMFLVRISGLSTNLTYWASTGAQPAPTRESYLLEWSPTTDGVSTSTGRWRNVCNRASAEPAEAGNMNGYHTVLFDGERINAANKRISSALDFTWFNLGCAGHALAKLELTGHTEAARAAGFITTIDERRTMLKMIVADYCGSGFPYTVAGQPLSWMDDKGWMHHSANVTIEARWTPEGASCLSEPRVDANPTPQGALTFPNGIDDVLTCAIPTCTNANPFVLAGTHLVSANPP